MELNPDAGAPTIRQARVAYPSGLTARQHAIWQAHQWQVAHAAENTPTPGEAYGVIVDLLQLLKVTTDELLKIERKVAARPSGGAAGQGLDAGTFVEVADVVTRRTQEPKLMPSDPPVRRPRNRPPVGEPHCVRCIEIEMEMLRLAAALEAIERLPAQWDKVFAKKARQIVRDALYEAES